MQEKRRERGSFRKWSSAIRAASTGSTNNRLLQVYLAKNAGEEEGAGILQVVVLSNASSLHRIHQQPTCTVRTWIILQIMMKEILPHNQRILHLRFLKLFVKIQEDKIFNQVLKMLTKTLSSKEYGSSTNFA
jgi:hypothetical protein